MKKLVSPLRPPTALRVLDTLLWIALPLLALMTVVVMIFVAIPAFGDGPYYVQGRTDQVIVEHVTPSGATVVQDVSTPFITPDDPSEPTVRFLGVDVQTQVSGFGPRLVLALASLANIAFAWVAVLTLKGITRSSLKGDVFTNANSTRLTRLGVAAIAYPITAFFIGRSIFNSVVSDSSVDVSGFLSTSGVDNWQAWLIFGLLLLALSKAFAWGTELHEFEKATI